MPTQLTLRGTCKSYGDRLVLDQVSFSVRPGERVGIVGENGCGKSTLLRLIAGIEKADDGEITVAAGGGVGHLGQTLGLPADHTVQHAVDAALAELRAMETRMRELEADLTEDRLAEYGDLLSVYEARDGYGADARVDKALHGLGLAHIDRDRRLGSLSGGEQARLGLACLLAASPEIMLLDEPTNHLDASSMDWLEERLRAHTGTVLAVSHDRFFLTRVATSILDVEGGAVTRFGGGYAGFLTERAAARQRWEQAYADWREEIGQVEAFAATTAHRVAHGRDIKDRNKMAYDRNAGRVQSSIAGRVRQAAERLRRLQGNPVPRPPEPLRFSGLFDEGTADGTLVELRDVRVGDRLTVDAFTVEPGRRLLVRGPNGAGKSTFLRILAGDLEPGRGVVRRRGRIGYLSQESVFARPEQTVLKAFAESRAGYLEEHRARLLSLGLLRADSLGTPVGALSIGQRRRLALARLLTGEADLLLLDEPTNHLSPTLVEELEQALDAYRGAIVVVSHDRALRGGFTGTEIEIRDGRLVADRLSKEN
ncbi:macrolide transport system ATP-binding/permease protein [Streptosporangium lutulentum]|uniref:Macrolide transport system ATP-binding/permease protein n=1 Tax=Streptosporangium lutulentum TaxID=1461250 RepID=A0ABT9Q7M7_9ACTN|nr:ABC-F family ATP-binding cassette domain-containing protein [Streptosporangium lutulentum]MDP9842089.1 macrolide transport system ATP-binding/permease protein [Streptosporangium lutulentum]